MNEKQKFNLYEDEPNHRQIADNSEQTSGDLVSDTTIVYLDFTKPLPELIKPIRDYLEDKPEGHSVGIYIVCGYEFNRDVSLFIEYINSIKQTFNFQFYFRGLVHSEFIQLLFFENIYFEKDVKLVYRQDSLHLLLKNLMKSPEIFRKFIQRFIDEYNKVNVFGLIDLIELETIGFKIQKF
jgi:hypothetical protein